MTIGPDTRAQHDKRISEGFPFKVFCSFFEGGLMFCEPLNTFTAHVPQMPAPPQFPVNFALSGYTSTPPLMSSLRRLTLFSLDDNVLPSTVIVTPALVSFLLPNIILIRLKLLLLIVILLEQIPAWKASSNCWQFRKRKKKYIIVRRVVDIIIGYKR